jgi:Reverse transcriptase (RNA-dependent DNA polymerase).
MSESIYLYHKKINSPSLPNLAKVKQVFSQGSIHGPLLFLIYMNDILKIINNKSLPVLFADYTIILFSHSNFKGFEGNMNTVFETLDNSLKEIYFQVKKNTTY